MDTINKITVNMGEKILNYCGIHQKNIVVAYQDKALAHHRDVSHIASNQEETSAEASCLPITQLDVYSPDMDVLLLLLRNFPKHSS